MKMKMPVNQKTLIIDSRRYLIIYYGLSKVLFKYLFNLSRKDGGAIGY